MTLSRTKIGLFGAAALALCLGVAAFAADSAPEPTTAPSPTALAQVAPAESGPQAAPAAAAAICPLKAASAALPVASGQAIICVCDSDADCSADDLCGKQGGICEITTPCEKDPRGSCFCGKKRDGTVKPVGP
jgi:hypothetical protein